MTDHTETLKLIMRTLQIPAAEYVPAIGDVFTIIENALRHDNPPATPEDRRDGERWRRLCEYVDVGEGRVLINHNYVDSRKNFVAEMSDSSDLIVNMDNAIAADKTRIAAIDAAREG